MIHHYPIICIIPLYPRLLYCFTVHSVSVFLTERVHGLLHFFLGLAVILQVRCLHLYFFFPYEIPAGAVDGISRESYWRRERGTQVRLQRKRFRKQVTFRPKTQVGRDEIALRFVCTALICCLLYPCVFFPLGTLFGRRLGSRIDRPGGFYCARNPLYIPPPSFSWHPVA